MEVVRRISKKLTYSLIAAVSCAVITCAAVLCFAFLPPKGPAKAAIGTINVTSTPFEKHFDYVAFNPSESEYTRYSALFPFDKSHYQVNGGPPQRFDLINYDSAPGSPGGCLRFTYPNGFQDGYSPDRIHASVNPTSEMYAQFYFKFSGNFTFHSVANKLLYIDVVDQSGTRVADNVVTYNYPYVTLPPGQTHAMSWGTQFSNPLQGAQQMWGTTAPVQKGVWHKLKIHLKMNTGTNQNGIFRMWMDDIQILNATNVLYCNSPNPRISSFKLDPVYGGQTNPRSAKPHEDYLYYDAVKIASTDIIDPPTPPLGPPNIMDHHFSNWGPFTPLYNIRLDPTNSAPGSPGGSARVDYQAGYPDGESPGAFYHVLNQSLDEIWLQFSFKYSDNYLIHPVANKLLYLIGENASTNFSATFNCDDGEIRCVPQGGSGGGYALSITTNVNTVKITPGSWYTVKIHIKLNTGTSSNGILEVWVNGTKTINRTNVQYLQGTCAGIKLQDIKFDPVLGGGFGQTKPADDYILYDAVKISTADFNSDTPGNPTAPTDIVR